MTLRGLVRFVLGFRRDIQALDLDIPFPDRCDICGGPNH